MVSVGQMKGSGWGDANRQSTQDDEQVPGRGAPSKLQPRSSAPGAVDERGDTAHCRGQGGEQERAPTMAPTAISPPCFLSAIATTGINDSGIAVATAASTLPTAPWPRPSCTPAHSTALVNTNAPATITAKLTTSSTPTSIKLRSAHLITSGADAWHRTRRRRPNAKDYPAGPLSARQGRRCNLLHRRLAVRLPQKQEVRQRPGRPRTAHPAILANATDDHVPTVINFSNAH